MFRSTLLTALSFSAAVAVVTAVSSQTYTWKNVKIGGGGGFVPNIVFNPSQKGLAFARTDIGGAYKLNSDDSWTPLLDFVDDARWNYWGVDAIATDPVDPNRLYLVMFSFVSERAHHSNELIVITIGYWDVHELLGSEQWANLDLHGPRQDIHTIFTPLQSRWKHARSWNGRGTL